MTRLHCALKTCFTLSRKLCACGLCRCIYRRVELRACVCIPLSPVHVCVCVHAYMHTSAGYGRVCVCVPLSISLQLVQVRRCVDLCGTWLPCLQVSRLWQRVHPRVSSQLLRESVGLLGRERRLLGDISVERTDSSCLDLDFSSLSPTSCPPNRCPKF